MDKIVCLICKEERKRITYHHLAQHGYSIKRYKMEFPEAIMECKNSKKLRLSNMQNTFDNRSIERRKEISNISKLREDKKPINKRLWYLGIEARKRNPKKRLQNYINTMLNKYGVRNAMELYTEKNHWHWMGGSSLENSKGKDWYKIRELVWKRDNYTCQECGYKKGHNLIPHHILPRRDYPKLIFDIDNGITLCKKCHKPTINMEYNFVDKYQAIVKKRVNSGKPQTDNN